MTTNEKFETCVCPITAYLLAWVIVHALIQGYRVPPDVFVLFLAQWSHHSTCWEYRYLRALVDHLQGYGRVCEAFCGHRYSIFSGKWTGEMFIYSLWNGKKSETSLTISHPRRHGKFLSFQYCLINMFLVSMNITMQISSIP